MIFLDQLRAMARERKLQRMRQGVAPRPRCRVRPRTPEKEALLDRAQADRRARVRPRYGEKGILILEGLFR
jgi:hypothetical protein